MPPKTISTTFPKKKGCSNSKKWEKSSIPRFLFCGYEGGTGCLSYPVDSLSRYRAALMYAHFAPNPAGIKRCAERLKASGFKGKKKYF